nr:hypothetical protein [Tanacetum cinerariifolium]
TEEQAAQSLLALHTPKRKSTKDQFIFHRRTPVTEEASTAPSAQPQDDASANIVRDSLSLEPELIHDNFVATMYPQVHQSLKHPDEEHTQVENPLSSTRTLSSMKNMDAYTFAHLLSTPVLDLSFPKHVPSTTQAPIFLATTTKTITTTLLPPLPHQSASVPNLASCVSVLEQVCANFEKRHTLQDNTVQGISSRLFTLKLRDLPHKVNQTGNEVVKEEWFLKSLPGHVALYEALEASMKCANRDEFLAKKYKSRKRCHDDQDPPPPPPDSGSKQPSALQSSAWKTFDTREAPFSSSKK